MNNVEGAVQQSQHAEETATIPATASADASTDASMTSLQTPSNPTTASASVAQSNQAPAAISTLNGSVSTQSGVTQGGSTAIPTQSSENFAIQSNSNLNGNNSAEIAAAAPNQLPSQVINTINDVTSTQLTPEKRDYLLAYAHSLYADNAHSPNLLPLLHTLENLDPDHLPTLLLLSCVYYTLHQFEASYHYNKKILTKDPQYVESYSNLGTTLRAMGHWKEAEIWWWKAVNLRPTYWDATENLLGVLCNPDPNLQPSALGEPAPSVPRYKEALALVTHVETQIFASEATTTNSSNLLDPVADLPRPRLLPAVVPTHQIHRLQNSFYAKGNLRLALNDAAGAQAEYEKGIEISLSVPAWKRAQATESVVGFSVRDLVVTVIITGAILAAKAQAKDDYQIVLQTIQFYGLTTLHAHFNLKDLLVLVQRGGDEYVKFLLQQGGGVLPTVLLQPEAIAHLSEFLFARFDGTLPSLLQETPLAPNDPTRQSTLDSVNQTTSTLVLTLAKLLQDASATDSTSQLNLGGIPPSPSLFLGLYYLALTLYPSPSTCNNLGILLSTLQNATTLARTVDDPTRPKILTGQDLALQYYHAGLRQDAQHPHLYTNLGSLLKDMGHLPQAVQMYKRAVECDDQFSIALCNLANALKDSGQIQESTPYYKRAVALNPNFPEAICGLVNALGGVCDWTNRGGVGEEISVDSQGILVGAEIDSKTGKFVSSGYMAKIIELVEAQLNQGMNYGKGSLRAYASLNDWLILIAQAIYNFTPEKAAAAMEIWSTRLQTLMSPETSTKPDFNEGGFLIRLIERLMRRIQRRWYLTEFGTLLETDENLPKIRVSESDLQLYRRPILPAALPIPNVPTVLPFHCFTLPVTARQTRLISHRNGLKISHSTLNQSWLPKHVYPPPRPAIQGKLNIGYVSSDLGNHPLSHLMQSVFGLHNFNKFNVFVYATSASDSSSYRLKIEKESQHFRDGTLFTNEQLVNQIVQDEIHVLINLGGYTKGARNEVFAARPAPIQMSFMGFAGPLAAGWCDYFIVDPIVCPESLTSGDYWRKKTGVLSGIENWDISTQGATDFEGDPDPELAGVEDFVYTEKLLYLPHSYFVTDHKQAWKSEPPLVALSETAADDDSPETKWAQEEFIRWQFRREMFPNLGDDTFIFCNWNQLYKIEPFVFRIWLNILKRVPNSILWLLKFPAAGELNLKETARKWAGEEIASRIIFTDVANKNEHIHRGRIPDLFLDTTECNAHTTAADILWSGTPILTYPRHTHKMASRVAASIVVATGKGDQMIVRSAAEYEERAVQFANSLNYQILAAEPNAAEHSIARQIQRRGRPNDC